MFSSADLAGFRPTSSIRFPILMRVVGGFFALALMVAPVATSETLQATDADTGLYLQASPDGWEVRQHGRSPVRLPSSRRFRPRQIVPTVDGWLVAGSVPRGDRYDLLILQGAEGRLEPLPRLSDQSGRVRIHPALAMENGRLLGAVWVEGDRQEEFVVRSAEWHGSEWGPIEEVSGRGRGAQLALASTVLADGSWLVTWSAFDGEDDEIVWSRRNDEGWSRPRRLHADNHVPDVTPTLLATGTGAVAAWSAYDGEDYRLLLAHFDGVRWKLSPPRGAKGSIRPRALARAGRYLVLHKTVIPEGWSLVELGDDGAPRRQAAIDRPDPEPPLILPTGEVEVEIAWPEEAGGPSTRSTPRWEDVQ